MTGSLAAPDNANPHRHRIHRTTGPVRKEGASWRLSYRHDGSIRVDVVSPASPVDGSRHVARNEHREAQHISQRTEPDGTLAPPRQPLNLYRNGKAARK